MRSKGEGHVTTFKPILQLYIFCTADERSKADISVLSYDIICYIVYNVEHMHVKLVWIGSEKYSNCSIEEETIMGNTAILSFENTFKR